MANNVSVEISANVQGYQQGMSQAIDSTKKYTTETRKTKDYLVNLNAEFRKAKKEAMNLSAGYAQLSAEEKKSQFGQEMKRQLDVAMQSAAEWLDMQGDIRTEMKNLASDTKALDMLSEAIGVVGDVVATGAGVFAQMTGNAEDAQRAVVAFTTAQSALGAVTKIANALQLQSNTMLAVQKVQALASAAATKIKTAAESRGVVVTKLATVAQAMFNKVAMANPYVLLAAAIIAVVGALATYIATTSSAESETEKQNRKIEESKKLWGEYKAKVAESAADQVAQYKALEAEWLTLKTTEEKNEFLDKNKSKFQNMGFAIDDINELEDLFVKNSKAVVAALKARAEAEAWGEIYKDRLKKKLENDYNGTIANGRYYRRAKAGDIISKEEADALGINDYVSYHGNTATSANMSGVYRRGITEQEAVRVNAYRNRQALQIQADETRELTEIENHYTDATRRASAATAELTTNLTHSSHTTRGNRNTGNRNTGNNTNNNSNNTQQPLTELEKLEAEVKKYEDQLKNVDLEAPDSGQLIVSIQENLKKAQDAVTKYKIAVGLEVDPSDLDIMEEQLKRKELMLRSDISQEDKDRIYQEILELRDEIQKEKIRAHIEIDPQIEINKDVQRKISDIMNNVNIKEEPTWDFSHIASIDPEQVESINKLVEQYNRLVEAKESLSKMMNEEGASDIQIAAAQEALDKLLPQMDALYGKLNIFQDVDNSIKQAIKQTEKLGKEITQVADAIKAAGELFSALGDVADNEGLQVAGIVAKAVATVSLSFAQALTTAKTWWEWLAFGASGLATMMAMISQIKSVNKFAEGGIVGGSSYSGDRIISRLNSGEMVLNARHQRNLFNMIDSGRLPTSGQQQIVVTGKIKGTDLLLVQKNTNKTLSKAHSSINIH